jgi:curved DNA-binding protein CbpA
MTQDHYEILQVHPKADQDAIAAAHARLSDLYAPARLDGAAEELAELARQKRDAIERAYAVLGDPMRRAAYDAEQALVHDAASDERRKTKDEGGRSDGGAVRPSSSVLRPQAALDYRPLPPARRAERARGFDAYPLRDTDAGKAARAGGRRATQPGARRWAAPAALAGLIALVVAISAAMTGGGPPPAAQPGQATTAPAPLDAFEAEIAAAQQIAQQNPTDSQAWVEYGNILYNSAEIVRENAPDSPLYQQRLPRWLEATQAYTRALAIEPGNAAVRADLGVSACFYGAATGDQSFVRSGTAEARRASAAAPDDPRVLLNLGHCLASTQPPQTQEAIAQWKRAVEVAPPGSPFAAQAQQLIAKYGQ